MRRLDSGPGQAHWNSAAECWSDFGPPLRPSPADVRVMERMARRAGGAASGSGPRVLMWGVTPEFGCMDWPAGTRLSAYDRAPDMIRLVWPGDIAGRRSAQCADWLTLSHPPASFDLAIGDGMFNLLEFPGACTTLLAQTARALSAGGLLVSRFFVQPPQAELPAQVFEALLHGRIGSFHAFKLRLAMAVQTDARAGVRLGDVHHAWRSAGLGIDAVAAANGWRREEVATIELYRGRDVRHAFPTWLQLRELFSARFELLDCTWPEYEIGDRCPIAAFRVRPGAA